VSAAGWAEVWVGLALVFAGGYGLGMRLGRRGALMDAAVALRQMARWREDAGDQVGSMALRSGAVVVEKLDDPPRPAGPQRNAEA